MNITHKFRLYPSNEQQDRLNYTLNLCRRMYNMLLSELNDQEVIDKNQIQGIIPDIKICEPEFEQVYSKTLQYECYRLFSNLSALSSTKKKHRKVGSLRFKGKNWFKSFTYNQSGFALINNRKLHLSKIGDISIKCHREIKGDIKQVTIKREASGKWFANICEERKIEILKIKEIKNAIGIDLGLIDVVYDSDGNKITNPRILQKQAKKLAKLQRQLAKKKKGSKNGFKAVIKVARQYEKITNIRGDFLHKVSRFYVDNYDVIGMEDLQIQNMIRNRHLAKSISDVSWEKLKQMISYKAENAGKYFIEINPQGTSQRCNQCGEIVKKSSAVRQHNCPTCKIDINRDYNSALEIRRLTINKILKELQESTLVEIPLTAEQSQDWSTSYVSKKQEAIPSTFCEAKC